MEETPEQKNQTLQRQSYLLRLWAVRIQGQVTWHAALVKIPQGETQGFTGLESLFEYLTNQTVAIELPIK
jgi:hypothetical protein